MTETNNIVRLKCCHGRPQKYFTEKERKCANNR